MRILRHLSIYLLALTFTLSACKKDEETPRGKFAQGVFIVNEGNYSDNDGSIGYFNPEDGFKVQDVYEDVNGEKLPGLYQSIYFNDNKAYIIDQVGNKIEVVEAETFEHVATINEGLSTPRYMVVVDGKGYVSNWGSNEAYIAVVDLTNFNVLNTITVGSGAEALHSNENGKIYVSNYFSNAVQVVDLNVNEIVDGIEVPNAPKEFVIDANGRLWVLSVYYDAANNWTESSNLSVIDLSTNRLLRTMAVPSGAQRIATNEDGSKIYVGLYGKVFELDPDATFFPIEPLFETLNLYALGVNPSDGYFYVGQSRGSDNGTVIIYTPEGDEWGSFPAGRYPNSFAFRN